MDHESVEGGKNRTPRRDVVRKVRSCILILLATSFLTVYLFTANQSAYACNFSTTQSSYTITQGTSSLTINGTDDCSPPGTLIDYTVLAGLCTATTTVVIPFSTTPTGSGLFTNSFTFTLSTSAFNVGSYCIDVSSGGCESPCTPPPIIADSLTVTSGSSPPPAACTFTASISPATIVQGGTITVTGEDNCGPPSNDYIYVRVYAASTCPSGNPGGPDVAESTVTEPGGVPYTFPLQPFDTSTQGSLPPGSYCVWINSSSYPSGVDYPLTVTGAGPAAAAALTISPTPQTIPQAQTATFDVDLSSGVPNTAYTFSVSGVIGAYAFTANPVTTDATGAANTQLVADATTPPTYCPGTYSFTVTATGGGSTVSADGGLTVTQVGSPLQASVATDKTSYRIGDTVTVSVTVSRPGEGTVTVTGPSGGPKTYTFTATSAGTETAATFTAQATGSYSVSVQADDFCGGTTSGQASFQVSPNTYDASVSLSGLPAQFSAALQVDGQSQGTIQGSTPQTLTFPIGSSHTVSVDQYVSGATGVRYYCAQNSWPVSAAGSNTFTYQTQYEFNVSINPAGVAQVSGGGWFNGGNSAHTSQAPQTIPGATGVQYVFQGWSVDDGAMQTGNQVTVTMNGPHTAVAQYKTQYLLTVNSPNGLGNPKGEGYYDSGSTAQFSVTSPVGYLIQQVFVQWRGDFTATSPQGSITMNGPKTINAVWAISYTNLYIAGGAIAALAVIAVGFGMHRRKPSGRATGTGEQPPPDGPRPIEEPVEDF